MADIENMSNDDKLDKLAEKLGSNMEGLKVDGKSIDKVPSSNIPHTKPQNISQIPLSSILSGSNIPTTNAMEGDSRFAPKETNIPTTKETNISPQFEQTGSISVPEKRIKPSVSESNIPYTRKNNEGMDQEFNIGTKEGLTNLFEINDSRFDEVLKELKSKGYSDWQIDQLTKDTKWEGSKGKNAWLADKTTNITRPEDTVIPASESPIYRATEETAPTSVLQNDPRYNRGGAMTPEQIKEEQSNKKEVEENSIKTKIKNWIDEKRNEWTANNVTLEEEGEPSVAAENAKNKLTEFINKPEEEKEEIPPVYSGENPTENMEQLEDNLQKGGSSIDKSEQEGKIASNKIKDIDIPKNKLMTIGSILTDPEMSGYQKGTRIVDTIGSRLARALGGNTDKSYMDQYNDTMEQKQRELAAQKKQDSYDVAAKGIKTGLTGDLNRIQGEYNTKSQAALDRYASLENQETMHQVMKSMINNSKDWIKQFEDRFGNFKWGEFTKFLLYASSIAGDTNVMNALTAQYGPNVIGRFLNFFGIGDDYNLGDTVKANGDGTYTVGEGVDLTDPKQSQAYITKVLNDIAQSPVTSAEQYNTQRENYIKTLTDLGLEDIGNITSRAVENVLFDNLLKSISEKDAETQIKELTNLAETNPERTKQIIKKVKELQPELEKVIEEKISALDKNDWEGYKNSVNAIAQEYPSSKTAKQALKEVEKSEKSYTSVPKAKKLVYNNDTSATTRQKELLDLYNSGELSEPQYKNALADIKLDSILVENANNLVNYINEAITERNKGYSKIDKLLPYKHYNLASDKKISPDWDRYYSGSNNININLKMTGWSNPEYSSLITGAYQRAYDELETKLQGSGYSESEIKQILAPREGILNNVKELYK